MAADDGLDQGLVLLGGLLVVARQEVGLDHVEAHLLQEDAVLIGQPTVTRHGDDLLMQLEIELGGLVVALRSDARDKAGADRLKRAALLGQLPRHVIGGGQRHQGVEADVVLAAERPRVPGQGELRLQ